MLPVSLEQGRQRRSRDGRPREVTLESGIACVPWGTECHSTTAAQGQMEQEPVLQRAPPQHGAANRGALRAEQSCAVGCAWDRHTGFPSTDWKYNLHLYHSCICEFGARSRLSVSPQGPVMTQGGDRASQCPQPPWEGLPAPTVAPPSPCQAVPACAHASPCAVIREQTGLCARAVALAAPSRTAGGTTSAWGQAGSAATGHCRQRSPGEHGTGAVPEWDLPVAVTCRNSSVLSGMWALLLRGGCTPASCDVPLPRMPWSNAQAMARLLCTLAAPHAAGHSACR